MRADGWPDASPSSCAGCGGIRFIRQGFGSVTPDNLDAHLDERESRPKGEHWFGGGSCDVCGGAPIWVCRGCSAEVTDNGLLVSTANEGHCSCGAVTQ